MNGARAKRILVTGATGFIGRHCIPALIEKGFEVHALSSRGAQLPNVDSHEADLMNPGATAGLLSELTPTHLLHLAWYAEPGLFWNSRENLAWVAASLNLYRAFVENGGRRMVAAGTCAEYDWNYSVLDEYETPIKPATLYGVSKAALHSVLTRAADLDGLALAWGRVFFLYGPGEKPGRLVSDVIRGLLQGRTVETTSGLQKRDFMHVADVAGAFAALCDSDAQGSFNIASGEARPLHELLKAIGDITGRPDLLRVGARPMPPGEPPCLAAATTRLTQEVGFCPRHDLESGLGDAIQWWQTHGLPEG
ncbi:MAG: NAD(P)-dependent oxidoreductase [Proteobacteria bacterium]|nr:NAD(P)-dependent oxidoreductase [Pseudomonadota bacterium]MBU1450602.1 NAD(P)-dependent oxidoreductase [Pseudomonadota bacterium]MBU2469181.1 NAD(P)-dependent oxidoreductase [Pseudomonadota bacterium]MBU2518683.1 NAD(P)-dependent oxidoreductase [Pseudomonadota bacterium]